MPSEGDLERIYLRYSETVFKRCLRFLRNRDDAAEATQDVFVRAVQHLADLENPGPWLMTVTRNVCLDRIKYHRRHPAEALESAAAVQGPDPQAAAVARVSLARVLESLPLRQRRALWNHLFADESIDSIAGDLGITYGAAAQLLFRARQQAQRKARAVAALVVLPVRLLRHSRSGRPRQPASGLASWLEPFMTPAVGLAAMVVGAGFVAPSPRLPVPSQRPPMVMAAAAGAAGAPVLGGRPTTAPRAATVLRQPRATTASSPPSMMVGEGVILPGPAGTDDAVYPDMVVSPTYSRDHTVFAFGRQFRNCLVYCPNVLLRTTDEGQTWVQVRGAKLTGAYIRLSPDYADDHRMVNYGDGVSLSYDGGLTFGPPIAGSGTPVFLPDRSGLLVLGPRPTIYRFDGKTGPALGLGADVGTGLSDAVFVTSSDFVAIRGHLTAAGFGEDLVRCSLGQTCIALQEGVSNWLNLSNATSGSDIFATSTTTIATSKDLGAHFTTLYSGPMQVASPAVGTLGGPVALIGWNVLHDGQLSGSWQELSGAGTAVATWPSKWGIESSVLLPDGLLLGDAINGASAGLRCSRDLGRTWSTGC